MSSSKPFAITNCHDTLPSHIAVVFDSELLLITNFFTSILTYHFYNQLTIWEISSHRLMFAPPLPPLSLLLFDPQSHSKKSGYCLLKIFFTLILTTIFYNQLLLFFPSCNQRNLIPQTNFCPDPATISLPHCILNSAAANLQIPAAVACQHHPPTIDIVCCCHRCRSFGNNSVAAKITVSFCLILYFSLCYDF